MASITYEFLRQQLFDQQAVRQECPATFPAEICEEVDVEELCHQSCTQDVGLHMGSNDHHSD